MPLVPIIANAVGQLIQYLKEKKQNQSLDALWTASEGMAHWIDWFSRFVADVFGAAKGGEDASEQWSGNAAHDIEQVGDDLKTITEHTYSTVIPHTLRWFDGYINSHYLVPIRQHLRQIDLQIGQLSGRLRVLEIWRKEYADPHIMDWRKFNSWFHTWPIGVVTTWHNWFIHPHDFAEWAATPLIGPLVSYLATPEHKQTRDNLSRIMVEAWQEVPNDIWEDVLQWAVTEK